MPSKLAIFVGILAFQSVRQVDGSQALIQVALVQISHPLNLLAQRFAAAFRQDRDPILIAFAIPHDDMPFVEANILDPQPPAFTMPQAGAVHHQEHQLLRPSNSGSSLAISSRLSTTGSRFGFVARGPSRNPSSRPMTSWYKNSRADFA